MGISVTERVCVVLELLMKHAEKRLRGAEERPLWQVEASKQGKYGLRWIATVGEARYRWAGEGMGADRAVLLWRPENNPTVLPVLNLHGTDLDGRSPEFRVRLGFFVAVGGTSDGSNALRFAGMRWETPERSPYCGEGGLQAAGASDEPGRHDFYHCQPIRGFEKSDKLSVTLACPWYPDALPTIPVPAENPFDLLWFALYSVYEKEWLQLFAQVTSRIQLPGDELQRLRGGVGHARSQG